MFHLDYDQMVARLVREYKHEVLGSSASQGSMRVSQANCSGFSFLRLIFRSNSDPR